MHRLTRFVLTGALLLSVSACADDAPAPDQTVAVQSSPDMVPAAPDSSRLVEADAPAEEVAVAPAATTAPLPATVAPAPAPAAPAEATPRTAPRQSAATTAYAQTVAVTVTSSAFEPARVALDPGVPARIVFTRTSDKTCATQVVFPSLGIGPVDLPLGEPVTVDIPANSPGEITFTCGMDMLRGTLVVGS